MHRFSNNQRVQLLLLCLFGAIGAAFTPVQASASKTPTATTSVSEASNAFGFRLYQQLSQRDSGKNILISPLSISAGLAMVYNGTNGQTKSEMAKALGWQFLDLPKLNSGYQALFAQLQHTRKTNIYIQSSLQIANALMVQQKFPLHPDFIQRCRTNYQADLEMVDFSKHETAARHKINTWIAEKTYGNIPDMLQQPLEPETRVVLIDALYFKNAWQNPFEHATESDPFTGADGKVINVLTMCKTGDYDCFLTRTLQAVRLPYAGDGMSMEIYLPASHMGLTSLVKQLSPEQWRSWQRQFSRHACTILLPRFNAEYAIDLKATLQRMGMSSAFLGAADFSGMAKGLFLFHALHRGKIAVNEYDTEVAAATTYHGGKGGGIPDPQSLPYDITVDHPFFYAIRAKDGTILFMGSIADLHALEIHEH